MIARDAGVHAFIWRLQRGLRPARNTSATLGLSSSILRRGAQELWLVQSYHGALANAATPTTNTPPGEREENVNADES